MTKKLLPAMIGVALTAGMTAAAADVSIMGHLDTSIVNNDVSVSVTDATPTTFSASADDTNFVCTTCSIGFKGSEDLGNGLKAVFKLDFQFDTVNRNSSGSITDRDQWLGLAGGFGQVRIGTISTGYKSHGAMIDPLYRTVLQGRDWGLQSSFHSSAGEELQGRADNTVRWDSADFNGVKLVAHYTLDSDETDGEDENPFGVGASYENGGVLVFADYLDNNQGSSDPDGEETAWKIGGKFSMGDIAVMAQYEDSENNSTLGNSDLEIWHIGGSYTMGNNLLYAAYGQGDGDFSSQGVSARGDYDAWTLAIMHSLSKRTKVYAGYNKVDGDGSGSFNFGAPTGTVTGSATAESDTFALGLKHKF